MSELTAIAYLSIDPEMVREVATGLEDGKDIAKRYGITAAQWGVLEKMPSFVNEVSRIRSEMDRSGQTFRLKAAVMAEKLLGDMYIHAMNSDTPVKDKASALQLLTRVADLEPKTNAQVKPGAGFSITINLPVAPQKEEELQGVEVVEQAPKEASLALTFEKGSGDDTTDV